MLNGSQHPQFASQPHREGRKASRAGIRDVMVGGRQNRLMVLKLQTLSWDNKELLQGLHSRLVRPAAS